MSTTHTARVEDHATDAITIVDSPAQEYAAVQAEGLVELDAAGLRELEAAVGAAATRLEDRQAAAALAARRPAIQPAEATRTVAHVAGVDHLEDRNVVHLVRAGRLIVRDVFPDGTEIETDEGPADDPKEARS